MELIDGSQYGGSQIVDALSLVVDADDDVDQVQFHWNGLAHDEGSAPYSVFGKMGSSQLSTVC